MYIPRRRNFLSYPWNCSGWLLDEQRRGGVNCNQKSTYMQHLPPFNYRDYCRKCLMLGNIPRCVNNNKVYYAVVDIIEESLEVINR